MRIQAKNYKLKKHPILQIQLFFINTSKIYFCLVKKNIDHRSVVGHVNLVGSVLGNFPVPLYNACPRKYNNPAEEHG